MHPTTDLIILVPREALRGQDKPIVSSVPLDECYRDAQPALTDNLVPQGLGRSLRISPFRGPGRRVRDRGGGRESKCVYMCIMCVLYVC